MSEKQHEPVTGEVSELNDDKPFAVVTERTSERFQKPQLASEARHEAATRPPVEDLTVILSCGDFGGLATRRITVKGENGEEDQVSIEQEPCDHPSSFGIPGSFYGITPGRCFKHTEAALTEKQRRKAAFLDAFIANPELGIKAACAAAGMDSHTTVYWWRDHDPEFRKNFLAIKEIGDAINADLVEETILTRILDPKSGADTLRMWWLQNRRGEKWKTAAKAGSGFGGTPAGGISGGNHVWLVGDQKQDWK